MPAPNSLVQQRSSFKSDSADEASENNREMKNMLDKFSVEALMMKQDSDNPISITANDIKIENPLMISNVMGSIVNDMPLNDLNMTDYAQFGLHQTFQNLKNLFVNYSLNNVSN